MIRLTTRFAAGQKHLFVGSEYTNIVDLEIQPFTALAGTRFLGRTYTIICRGASALLPASDNPGVIRRDRVRAALALTRQCRVRKIKRPERHASSNDWPNHLALPHYRKAGRRRDGCGV
jgi:hypothetical protein